jgi:hypothetical protein
VAILWLAPLASSTSPPFTWTAPYSGKVVSHLTTLLQHQNCTNFSFVHPTSLGLASGIATGMISTGAVGCGMLMGPTVQAQQLVAVTTVPLTIRANGTYRFNATWKVVYTTNLTVWNVSAGSRATAEYQIEVFDTWRDLSTGRNYSGGSTSIGSQSIYLHDNQSTVHRSNTTSAVTSVSLVAGEIYEFTVHLEVVSECFVLRGTGAHALAVVNWATNGNHAQLLSLSLS